MKCPEIITGSPIDIDGLLLRLKDEVRVAEQRSKSVEELRH